MEEFTPVLEEPTVEKPVDDYSDLKPDEDSEVCIFVNSAGTDAVEQNGVKYLKGSINGVNFSVACDQNTYVKPEIASALSGLIASQRNKNEFTQSLKVSEKLGG